MEFHAIDISHVITRLGVPKLEYPKQQSNFRF